MPWLYTALRKVFRRGVEFYFLDLQVEGHVPPAGPVILAANHPNSVLDALVLGSEVARPIGFLARSGLFSGAAGPFLRAAGAIPVHRRQDGPSEPGGNDDAFSSAFDVLAKGGVIGIFPEGRNAPERHVRDLKTGAARIALGAEAANDWALDVRLIPVGMNYEERDSFLGRALVRFGDPLLARDYREAYERDPHEAARALTEDLQTAMRAQAIHVHREEHTRLLHAIDALVGAELREELVGSVDLRTLDEKFLQRVSGRGAKRADLEGQREVRQWIADGIAHFERTDPEGLERLSRNIARYEEHLAGARLKHDFAERSPKTLSARWEALKATLYALALGPAAAWGLLHNFAPYRLTRRFALAAPEEAIRSVRAVGGGALFFGITYALFATAVWHTGVHVLVFLGYLLSLPISGVWFLRYRQRLGRFAHYVMVRTMFISRPALLKRLLLERTQLLVTIDVMRREYQALRRSS